MSVRLPKEPLKASGKPLTEDRRLLRGSIISLKAIQNANDFHEASQFIDDRLRSLAVGDILDSAKIPMLQDSSIEDTEFDSMINRDSVDAINSSTIYRSLSQYDPNCSEIYMRNMRGLRKKKKSKKGKGGLAEELRRQDEHKKKLVEALELWEKARKIGSVGSLTIYFAAGVLFDEIDMHEKAIEAFKRAARMIPAEVIVDTYMLPEDAQHKRKVERYSRKPLQDYLEDRARKREKLIFEETERQRLCAIVSYAQMVRLYLILQKYRESQAALASAFELTNQASEHSELLKYAHDIYKTNWEHSNREVSRSYKIVNNSAGTISETHLQILHELLEENSRDVDVLTWLGHRYTERCNFEVARDYYQRARSLKTNKAALLNFTLAEKATVSTKTKKEVLSLPNIENESTVGNKYEASVTIEKIDMKKGYDIDVERDNQLYDTRTDFTRFTNKREGSKTIIYAPPEAGYDPGAELAIYNLYRSKNFDREEAQKMTHETMIDRKKYPNTDPKLYMAQSI